MKIKGVAAHQPKARLEKFEYVPKDLGPMDVEVAITHCGICHSDIHLIDNDWEVSQYPLVPGHEIIGTVRAIGSGVRHLAPGDRVGIGWQRSSCMICESCLQGEENLCAANEATCVGNYGGFAEAIRTDSRFTFKIPEKLRSENAAPLLCGGITVYAPLRNYDVRPAMKVGVIGIGGLGHLALQFARAFGCEVTAFSSTPEKEKEARGFGAHHFVLSRGADRMHSLGASYDFILTTVYANLDWTNYLNLLKPKGKICFVGVTSGPISIPSFSLISGRKSVCGSPIGSRIEIMEMLDFAVRHGIQAKTEVVPMSEANAAVERVRSGKARYRMVLRA